MIAATTRRSYLGSLIGAQGLRGIDPQRLAQGNEARGDGVMRRYLTVQPANLRLIAKNNGGKFPFWEVYHKIEGQTEVRGHGSREMPVWGDRFRTEAGRDGKATIAQAAGRILSLTYYLEYIQER